MHMPLRFEQCLTCFGVVLVVTALAAVGSGVSAQDLEPRAYTNTPVGLNFVIAGYSYSSGGVVTDPGLPVRGGDVQVHSAIPTGSGIDAVGDTIYAIYEVVERFDGMFWVLESDTTATCIVYRSKDGDKVRVTQNQGSPYLWTLYIKKQGEPDYETFAIGEDGWRQPASIPKARGDRA